MTHALSKSVGPWSAGTRVEVINNNRDGTYTVEVPHIKASKETGIEHEDLLFDIESECVVELRRRSMPAQTNTRKERRNKVNKRIIDELVTGLMEKNQNG